MRQALQHTFESTVWNILCHPQDDILFIETRSEANTEVRFSAFDINDNKFLWQDIAITDTWWCSLLAAAGNKIYLYEILDGHNPEPSLLIDIDIRRKKRLWQIPQER